MTKDPWTEPNPQPGDFDAFLKSIDSSDVEAIERHGGNPDAGARLVVSIEGEEAAKLQRLARERGQGIDETVADLLRSVK